MAQSFDTNAGYVDDTGDDDECRLTAHCRLDRSFVVVLVDADVEEVVLVLLRASAHGNGWVVTTRTGPRPKMNGCGF